MTHCARWLLACLLFSALCWAGLFFAVGAAFAASPPECRGDVCVMQGPGGLVLDWKLHVQLNDLAGRRFIVPAGATCASACAIAVGVGLYVGADIEISPTATFAPHNRAAILAERRMPVRFRDLMLAYRPFHWH